MSPADLEKLEGIDPEGDSAIGVENMSTKSETIVPSPDPESPVATQNKPDVPPDGGYGWVCVACVFLINGHTWGVNSVSTTPSIYVLSFGALL
jgi:hypothetical protein